MNILEQLKAVATARAEAANLVAQKRQLEDDFKAEHMELFQQVAESQKRVGITETTLRDIAVANWLDAFKRDFRVSKVLMPGITIRESKIVEFDRVFATSWALRHSLALKLDEAAYRKLVLMGTVAGFEAAPGQVNTEYTAAIAADLDAVLSKTAGGAP